MFLSLKVDVMACVVSIKETCIVDGKLKHSDVCKIWQNYETHLHEWLLKLTEEFDLTFSIPEQKMSIVPCLLPDKEPSFEWPAINLTTNKQNKIKEFQVIYTFAYIPAGLFNRIQVRLFNYADNTSMWKTGSLLKKNNHMALLTQVKNLSIEVKVQGSKPENIVFLIHEVIETLINESYHGIQYDYSFPCPECVEEQFSDPCLFSSAFLRRANDYKAPFLQCNKYFHAISIQEMLTVMPVEGVSSLDLNLEYSLRDLKQLKKNLKYDIAFWFCHKDKAHKEESSINPLTVIEKINALKAYNVWVSTDPANEKIDRLTYAIKESRLVILGRLI